MIVYRLHCSNGHRFEGWFASGEAYSSQRAGGKVACPSCDDRAIDRLPSAPYVNTGRGEPASTAPQSALEAIGTAGLPAASVVAAVKAFLKANTEDVGRRFPEVARRIHYGEEDHRGIRGKVTREEARVLEEEGVPAVALPPELALGEEIH